MSVDILISSSIYNHIVVTPSSSETSYVITINSVTGRPFFSGIPMVDMFPNHTLAVHQVNENYPLVAHFSGENIIGIAKDNNISVIGLVDNAEVTGWMPGGSLVKTVRHITYVTIPYNSKTNFEEFQLDNNHIFCESYDITRSFPSDKPPETPDTDFIYNKEWIKSLGDINLDFCCVKLVQGLCLSYSIPGRDFSITYILRRSSLNPGTRYLARGLNDKNEPANEIECELIFSRDKDFWIQRWRRGSAPIRWNTTLSTAFSKPIHTAGERFFNGTAEYFKKLLNRYGNDTLIRCFSLLESGEHKSERDIHDKFKESISMLQKGGMENVTYNPFDLNFYLHYGGTFAAFNKLKEAVTPYLENDGFLTGTFPNNISNTQKGLIRFNCADSLDRANLATFFYSLVVVEKWIKENEGRIDHSVPKNSNGVENNTEKNPPPIPVPPSAPSKHDNSENEEEDLENNSSNNENENNNSESENIDNAKDNSKSENENTTTNSNNNKNDNNNNNNNNINNNDNSNNISTKSDDNSINTKSQSDSVNLDNIRLNNQNLNSDGNSSNTDDNTNSAPNYIQDANSSPRSKRKSGSSSISNSAPNITLYKPSPYLSQDVIDFLAKAFVTSGNVVSYLYTNTPAIKTEHIRKFSPTINVEKSDSSITLQRRYQNVTNDPGRNKIIMHFVNPGRITSKFLLDPDHIFPVPGPFPYDLFKIQKTDATINKSHLTFRNNNDLIIALPRPMSISRFCIHRCTASSLIILSGLSLDKLNVIGHFEIPQSNGWCRFLISNKENESIASISQSPNTNTNNDISLFLVVRFFSQDDSFTCGNIRIGCQLPLEGQMYNKWMPLANDESSIDRFVSLFDEFMKSERSLKDALDLEKARLGLNIAEDIRDGLAIKNNINPFLCDSNSLMYVCMEHTNLNGNSNSNSSSNPFLKCAFCNRNGINEKEISYFQRSQNFRGLVTNYISGDEYLPCCKVCKEFASNCSMLANLYTEEYIVPVDLNNPKFEPLIKLPDKERHLYETSFPSTASFMDVDENKLLSSKGGEVVVKGKRKFIVFYYKNTIISKVRITASSTDFKLLYEDKEVESNKINDNTLDFIFTVEPITHIFSFEIVGDVTLHKFKSTGIYTIDVEQDYDKVKKLKAVPEVNSYGYEWHDKERYALYKFDGKKRISEFGINIMRGDSNTFARSLFFVHYADNVIVCSTHYVLPKVEVGTNLWYKVNTEPFNKLIVYYTDKIATVHPHIIGFNFC